MAAPARLPANPIGASRRDLEKAMQSRLAEAERMGTYGRRLEAVREHLWMFLWETGKKFASHLLSSDNSKGWHFWF